MKFIKDARLWKLTRGQRLRYAAAVAAMGAGVVSSLLVPIVTLAALDALARLHEPELAQSDTGARGRLVEPLARLASEHGTAAMLAWAAGAGLVLTALAGACQYLRGRWSARASEAIVRRTREELFDHVSALPCEQLDRLDTGDLVQRCTSDVETVKAFLSVQVVEIGHAVLLVGCALPLMLWLEPRLAALSLALFPIIVVLAVVFFRRVKSAFQRADEAEAELTSLLQENLTAIRVVRSFARQDHECARFAVRNAAHRDLTAHLIRLLGAYWAASDLLCLSQMGLGLIGGAWLLARGDVSLGEFFAFQLLLGLVIWPARQLGRLLTDSGKAVVSLGRLREVLALPAEDDGVPAARTGPHAAVAAATGTPGAEAAAAAAAPGAASPSAAPGAASPSAAPAPLRGEIAIEGLSFRFAPDGPLVLDGVSLHVRPGQTVALLGPPGAGKSVLVQLLLRLYDGYEGSIRLDGRELSTLGRRFVRGQIGAALAEPFLYSRTVDANVRLDGAHASDEQLTASTVAACIHDEVIAFEHGYQTLVGERGVTLSGGQRQRLALARALLGEAPILVLDDALSAVDVITESRIAAALAARRGRRTTIVIAHRLSSVLDADEIVVLEHGRIVQRGDHAALLAQPGPYRRLWSIQGALEEALEAATGVRHSEQGATA